jgi:hypothetical protein
MIAKGELPPVDYAIHSDTTWEHIYTYNLARKWTPWLENHGVKVRTVYSERTEVVREDWSGPVIIPAFTENHETGHAGQVRRECTHDWKITPIRRFIRTIIDKPVAGCVEMIMGISFDEWSRMKTSDVKYIENTYPLVDSRISRADCVGWLEKNELEIPGKSGCVFCPYTSRVRWQQLKRRGGKDWDTAIEIDESIRHKRPGHDLFIHAYRKPLPTAVSIPEDFGAEQMEMWPEATCDGGHCFT